MHSGNKLESFVQFLEKEFFQKKILILGFGKEGQSTFKLLTTYLPEVNLFVADENKSLINSVLLKDFDTTTLHFGQNYLEAIKLVDVVIKSPGVKLLPDMILDTAQVTSQTDLFLRFYKKQVVGVTGTKGKSTTATLIHHILISVGKKSVLLGNIGLPAFNLVPEIEENTIVVFELSSHQLEFVTTSPHIAVLLNIFPEHLDYFNGFEDYKNAKENIFRYQTNQDILIAHNTLKESTEKNNSEVLYFNSNENLFESDINAPLIGEHNFQNISAAILVANQFGISLPDALKTLHDFKSLPHRLEYAGKFREIDFYNDSISTIPESAIAAVEAIKKVDTLILGGFDRGLDYSKLAAYLSESNISNFIFLGKAGESIKIQLEKIIKSDAKLIHVSNLEEAFPIIVENTKPGFVCLLSPAASSYDQFHNFEHRGDTFKDLAKKLEIHNA